MKYINFITIRLMQ